MDTCQIQSSYFIFPPDIYMSFSKFSMGKGTNRSENLSKNGHCHPGQLRMCCTLPTSVSSSSRGQRGSQGLLNKVRSGSRQLLLKKTCQNVSPGQRASLHYPCPHPVTSGTVLRFYPANCLRDHTGTEMFQEAHLLAQTLPWPSSKRHVKKGLVNMWHFLTRCLETDVPLPEEEGQNTAARKLLTMNSGRTASE